MSILPSLRTRSGVSTYWPTDHGKIRSKMDAPLLLDTCAAIWIANGDKLSVAALDAVDRTRGDDESIYVSPITAWEIGLLVSRGRMNLQMPPTRWFTRLMQAPGLRMAE